MNVGEPIHLDDAAATPWKNGGGVTRTLAVGPENAGMDDFQWRLSLATVASSGAFSRFAGVDRTILLYRGLGMVLKSAAWGHHALTGLLEPFHFHGEDDVECDLVGGEAMDLNLMLRRGKAAGTIEILHGTSGVLIQPAEEIVLVCAQGAASFAVPHGEQVILTQDEFVRISGASKSFRLSLDAPQTSVVCAAVRLLV